LIISAVALVFVRWISVKPLLVVLGGNELPGPLSLREDDRVLLRRMFFGVP